MGTVWRQSISATLIAAAFAAILCGGHAMGDQNAKRIIHEILDSAGIGTSGDQPCDLRIKDERFYRRVLSDGALGLGESYMDGWWDCEKLDEFFCQVLKSDAEEKVKNWKIAFHALRAKVLNIGNKSRAFAVGERHYDLGNELYRSMLDKRMVYSCGYWNGAKNLDEAQEAKLDLVCRKIGIRPGDRVLDIGCGWGGFAKYAAEAYGAHVVGVTVSREQVSLGREMCQGLPVELRLQDFRDINEKFDHVVSIGMFEHVGHKNYRAYMAIVHRCLNDGGSFLLHTIGNNVAQVTTSQWLGKYIFPNSVIPSMSQISAAAEGFFVTEDIHNIAKDYDPTLRSWFDNFNRSWNKLRGRYGDRFFRMWKYYLLSSAGSFKGRHQQVWQIVFSKNGSPGGYRAVR